MRARLSSRGHVALPKEIRDALDLQPGAVLDVWIQDGRIVLRPIDTDSIGELSGRFSDDDFLTELEAERRHELARDPTPGPGDAVERPDDFYDRSVQREDVRAILRRLA